MAKSLHAELIAILRKFKLASEETKRKEISNIISYPERQFSRLLKFTYEKQSYYALFDSSANDDVELVLSHIRLDVPDVEGSLVRSPLEDNIKAYGIPHLGKGVYLLTKKTNKVRLDQELVERFPDFTRSTIQKFIKAGYVTVNSEPARSSKQSVTENDSIALTLPEPANYDSMELPIIYIDDNVIVINKPAGILTHSKGVMNDEFTVADFFRRYTTSSIDSTRPGIVHRLDRDTSGVMIGARNDDAALMLKKQFAERTVRKQYAAVVDGVPKLEEAIIDLPIGRNPSSPSTFRVDVKGKSAVTGYKIIKTNGNKSLLEFRPKTGRTHQLRVHAQYMKTPVCGDRIYGSTKTADRLCLHAYQLELTIPGSERKIFTADIPKVFDGMVG